MSLKIFPAPKDPGLKNPPPPSAWQRRKDYTGGMLQRNNREASLVERFCPPPSFQEAKEIMRRSRSPMKEREVSVVVSDASPECLREDFGDVDVSPASPFSPERVAKKVDSVACNHFCRTESVTPISPEVYFSRGSHAHPCARLNEPGPEAQVSVYPLTERAMMMPLGKPPRSPVIPQCPSFVSRLYPGKPKTISASNETYLQKKRRQESNRSDQASSFSKVPRRPYTAPVSRSSSLQSVEKPGSNKEGKIPSFVSRLYPVKTLAQESVSRSSSQQSVEKSAPKKEGGEPSFVSRLYPAKPSSIQNRGQSSFSILASLVSVFNPKKQIAESSLRRSNNNTPSAPLKVSAIPGRKVSQVEKGVQTSARSSSVRSDRSARTVRFKGIEV